VRNRMDAPYLREFQDRVARQAAAFPGDFFLAAPQRTPAVALTFDDGPDAACTPRLLDLLRGAGARATFFVVGVRARRYPEMVRRMKAEGHEIGAHGWVHQRMDLMGASTFATHVEQSQALLSEISGALPVLFRPPYGSLGDDDVAVLAKRKIRVVNWSVDSFDWREGYDDPERITKTVLDLAHPGAIILFHCSQEHDATLRALPRIIDTLRRRGYALRAVSELLPPPRSAPRNLPPPVRGSSSIER